MNAIEQALAELAARNASRCTVEEIIEPEVPPQQESKQESSEPVQQPDERSLMLANTMVLFSNISADTLLMSDIIRRSGGVAVYIMQKTEDSLNNLVKTVVEATNVTRIVTDFSALPIQGFVRLVNETKVDVVVINQNPENHEALTLIMSKIREQVSGNLDDRLTVERYPEDRTYTQVYMDYLNCSRWFLHQEIYNAYTSDAEFRKKTFLIYVNEIPYVSVEEWTNVRLFNLATVGSNDIVYTSFVFSNANKHRNNFTKVSDTLIVSDYHYTDAFDYVEFIRQIHHDSVKQFDKVNFFLLFSTRYGDNASTAVRLISYESQETNQTVHGVLRDLIGELQGTDMGGAMLFSGMTTTVSREEIVRVIREATNKPAEQVETVTVNT